MRRLCFLVGLILTMNIFSFRLVGNIENKIDDPFLNIAMCESLSGVKTMRLPMAQVKACLKLKDLLKEEKFQRSKVIARGLIRVAKKLDLKAMAVAHIDEEASQSILNLSNYIKNLTETTKILAEKN